MIRQSWYAVQLLKFVSLVSLRGLVDFDPYLGTRVLKLNKIAVEYNFGKYERVFRRTQSGLDLDGFISKIRRRQKSFDLRQKFV